MFFGQNQSFWLDQGASAKTVILKKVTKIIAAKAGKSVAMTTAVGKLGALVGPYLAPLGIGLLASAAGVKALRVKGQKSSRAQVLNDLLQKLDDVQDATAPKMDPGQKQITGPTDSPKRITQQDQLPAVVDTTTDLVAVADPQTPEEEKQEIVQNLSGNEEAVRAALTRANVPEEKIEQIIQRLNRQDTSAVETAVQEVEPELEAAAEDITPEEDAAPRRRGRTYARPQW